jgi:hypothetical protein
LVREYQSNVRFGIDGPSAAHKKTAKPYRS